MNPKNIFCQILIAAALITGCTDNKPALEEKTSPSPAPPDQVTEGTVLINGADIYYKIIGEGEPLVIVHGGPGLDHTYFLPQLANLSSEYQLIFMDQRACGKSSADVDTATISIIGFIEDIEGLRQSLGLGKISLLAHSWGGLLGMHYGIKYSGNLNSLILMNPMSPSSALRAVEDSVLATRDNAEDSVAFASIRNSSAFKNRESTAFEDFFRILFRREFYNKTYADSLTLTFPKEFAKNNAILQHLGKDIADYDIFDSLEKIKCPTLIIYGDYDPLSAIVGDKINESIPNSQYTLLKNCGHFPYIEQQKELIRIIREFKIRTGQ